VATITPGEKTGAKGRMMRFVFIDADQAGMT